MYSIEQYNRAENALLQMYVVRNDITTFRALNDSSRLPRTGR